MFNLIKHEDNTAETDRWNDEILVHNLLAFPAQLSISVIWRKIEATLYC